MVKVAPFPGPKVHPNVSVATCVAVGWKRDGDSGQRPYGFTVQSRPCSSTTDESIGPLERLPRPVMIDIVVIVELFDIERLHARPPLLLLLLMLPFLLLL